MGENSNNVIGTPWWINSLPTDYTRSRSGLQYDSPDDLIGRRDVKKFTLAVEDVTTISGTSGTVLR